MLVVRAEQYLMFRVTNPGGFMNSDQELQAKVLAELRWEPSVNAAHIGVTAKNGVVTLSGHVTGYLEKQGAERCATRVNGVKAVAEEIEVRLSLDTRRSDEDIATAVLSRLSWSSSVPTDSVKVKVEKGWITLTGQVSEYYQKIAAEMDVRGLHGVTGISNKMTIKPRVDTVNVSEEIRSALNRSWFFGPKTVSVSAEGGKITLSGTVHSLHDRRLASAIAWSAPGAIAVDNELAIV